MTHYRLVYSKDFQKIFKKMDSSVQKLVASYIKNNLENKDSLKIPGRSLPGEKKGITRFKIGNYRLVTEIRDNIIIVLMLTFGYQKDKYPQQIKNYV